MHEGGGHGLAHAAGVWRAFTFTQRSLLRDRLAARQLSAVKVSSRIKREKVPTVGALTLAINRTDTLATKPRSSSHLERSLCPSRMQVLRGVFTNFRWLLRRSVNLGDSVEVPLLVPIDLIQMPTFAKHFRHENRRSRQKLVLRADTTPCKSARLRATCVDLKTLRVNYD